MATMDPALTGKLPARIVAVVKQQNVMAAVQNMRHEEYQYLDLVQEILETGEHRPDR